MSDEIISRLLRKRKKLDFLTESTGELYEVDEDKDEDASGADEEFAALNDEDADVGKKDLDSEEEDHDDSQAPIQGKPDDKPHTLSHSPAPMKDFRVEDEESDMEEEPPVSEEPKPEKSSDEKVYDNPLDNEYAVHFTLGDEVNLTATGTKNSDLKKGVIEGYDPEGFYKVKWSDESTTNGLTDIALESLVKTTRENRCICGCDDFVEEDGKIVCDKCGRLHEGTLDALTLADKSRLKGKRIIRSIPHEISTANRPNIDMAEAIRKALKGKAIREDDNPDEESTPFDKLKTLDNEFWTRIEEMKRDIEDLGYAVEEMNNEYIIVSSDEDDENVYKIPVGGTSRTITLDISKAKMI